jgi:hypothetical protein
MQTNDQKQNENLQVAKFDPVQVYAGASQLSLSETEMKNLCAPFNDDEYEIRPDGFIYIPQSITLKRLNDVIGIGKWALTLINNGKDEVSAGQFKVFFDGALIIRGCFVSRAVGESSYSRSNQNSSWASAFEAAKSDCRQRCCKDLGIANDAWNPSFMRKWKAQYATKVFVRDSDGKNKMVWRRKDVEPFWNEVSEVPNTPSVPGQQSQPKEELPWLNHGPDYDAQLRELIAGEISLASIRATRFRVSKQTEAALIDVLTRHWINKTDECADLDALTKLYNDNKTWIDAHPFILKVFTDRRVKVVKKEAKAA